MSFILDAIAKSEQERQQQDVPQAQILALPVGDTARKRRLLPYFVATALILNAVVFAIWMQSDQPDPAGPALDKAVRVEAPEQQVIPPEPVEQAIAQEIAEPEIIIITSQASAEPVIEPVVVESKTTLRETSRLSELPSNVRKDMPTIVFSGHLYSSNPAASFVYVDNNRLVKKDQRIVGDVYLHEITPTGVVVEFQGYLIDVGVLQNWTLN